MISLAPGALNRCTSDSSKEGDYWREVNLSRTRLSHVHMGIPEIMGYLQCLNDLKINRKRLKLESYKNRGSDSQNVIIINVEYYFQIRISNFHNLFIHVPSCLRQDAYCKYDIQGENLLERSHSVEGGY